MPRAFQLLALVLLAGSLASPAVAQKGVHKDSRIGFELKPPKDWGQVPVDAAEEWIVAKYQSDKEDLQYDKEDAGTWRHKPRLMVIAFLDEAIQRQDVEQDEDTGDKAETRVRVGPIYKDYAGYAEDYFKSNYGVGYYEALAEDKTQNGLPVRCLELQCEGVGGPKLRAMTWVFETEIGKVAVQLECLAEKFDKNKKDFEKTLKSFRPIERTKSMDAASAGGFLSFFALDELSPEDRKLRRQEQEQQEWSRMTADLLPGWKATEIDGVRVLTHTDERHAAKVVEMVRATRAWLDQTFPQIGAGEYTRMPLVRICENEDEEALFHSGTGLLLGSALTTYKDIDEGADSDEWGQVATRTMEMWFLDRDQMLWIYMPAWLKAGLNEVLGTAVVKGKKIEFNPDWWELYLKDYLREKGPVAPTPARALMTLQQEDFYEGQMQARYDAMCLVRMLVNAKAKKHKEILPAYLSSLSEVLGEIRAEQRSKDTSEKKEKPKNEAEEEAYFEKQKKRAVEEETRLLQETLSRSFAGWSEKDWENFEGEFLESK